MGRILVFAIGNGTMRLTLGVGLVLLLCVGPALAQVPDSVSLTPPKTVWDTDLDGTAIHRISTMSCPVTSGTFKRANIQLYDKVGWDVGCDYRMTDAGITIYLTKIDPAKIDENFKTAKEAVGLHSPGAAMRDATLAAPPGFEWRHASFTLTDGRISDVLMAPMQEWYFEVRATYALAAAEETAKALAELSATALNTAGVHLKACAARPDAPPGGKRIIDQSRLMMFSLFDCAALGEFGNKSAKDSVSPTPMLSCADGSFQVGNQNYVFWTDTAPGAPTGLRITGIEKDYLATARPSLGGLLAALAETKGGEKAGPSVTVVVDAGDSWNLMAAFEGLPSMEDMAKAALLGQPFSSVSKTGKNIKMYMPPDKTPPPAK